MVESPCPEPLFSNMLGSLKLLSLSRISYLGRLFTHDEFRIRASVNSWIARIEHHLQRYQRIRKGSPHHETLPVGAAEANIVSATDSGHKNLGRPGCGIGPPRKGRRQILLAGQKFRPNLLPCCP